MQEKEEEGDDNEDIERTNLEVNKKERNYLRKKSRQNAKTK